MEIKKVTDVFAVDSDGNKMIEGQTYAFDITENKCYAGVFRGLSSRNALAFDSIVSGEKVHFCVMPSSIVTIKKVEVQ